MSFIVKCRVAIRDEEAFEVEGVVMHPRFAKLLVMLYDGMPPCDRKEFFDQHPREIRAAIELSLSGKA